MTRDILETKYDEGVLEGMRIAVDALNNMIHNGELIVKHPFGPLDPEMMFDVGTLGVNGDDWRDASLEIFFKKVREDDTHEKTERSTTGEKA